jgi:energy-coupling factor transport system permease protein
MMISIALRSIPTLINESQRILKAQASRGVDFNEGKLKDKINQIISLLVPMFVISYKKAEDLAYAMEARGYIPGKERSKLEVLKYKLSDYLVYVFVLLFISLIIIGKILKVI